MRYVSIPLPATGDTSQLIKRSLWLFGSILFVLSSELSLLNMVFELLSSSIAFPTEIYIIGSREIRSDKKWIIAPTVSGNSVH